AVPVEPPAFDRAGAHERAAVGIAGADRNDSASEPGDGGRGEVAGRRAVAELAVVVLAPAFDAAGTREGARMGVPAGDRGHSAEAGNGHRREAVGPRAVAELSAVVVSPALDAAVAHDRASVVVAAPDCGHPACEAGHSDRGGAAHSRPVAELAVPVVAPA